MISYYANDTVSIHCPDILLLFYSSRLLKQLHHFCVVPPLRNHQCALTIFILRGYISTRLQEYIYDFRMAVFSRVHQSSTTMVVSRIYVSPVG